jgi:hypothetical protein
VEQESEAVGSLAAATILGMLVIGVSRKPANVWCSDVDILIVGIAKASKCVVNTHGSDRDRRKSEAGFGEPNLRFARASKCVIFRRGNASSLASK